MGRKNIVSKRIINILNGKFLRFTAIHDEYKKCYRKTAYKQVADNLKILQLKGVVSYIGGHYYLTEDSDAGKLREEHLQLARETAPIFTTRMEDIVKALENFLYLFALGDMIEVPFHLFWDKKRIRELVLKQQDQLDKLMHILELEMS